MVIFPVIFLVNFRLNVSAAILIPVSGILGILLFSI